MEYLLASFKSRTDAVALNENLRRKGIRSAIIPTPKQQGVGCGLSVKVYAVNPEYVVRAISAHGYRSFIGLFAVTERSGGFYIRQI
ncbi:MAG: DUF3343 domain-containing protein [Clostridia bacterium]|nr:DUF3343 domain-containing protein [Clostridia bacterium]